MSEARPQHPQEPAEGAEEAEKQRRSPASRGPETTAEGRKRPVRRGPSSTRRSPPREQKRPRRLPVPIEPRRSARTLALSRLLAGSEKVVARARRKERESGADRLGDGGRSLGTPNRGSS
jgi:hypothetical protein